MYQGTYASGTFEVCAFKNGTRYDKTNYPALFNSISSLRVDVGGGETSTIEITCTPAFADVIDILESGILGISATGEPGSSQGGGTFQPAAGSPAPGSGDAPASSPSNATYYAARFLYPDEPEGESPWYGGFTCVPNIDIGGGVATITIKVTGIHVLMSIMGGPVVIDNRSALEVIKEFASKFGVEVTFDAEDTETEALLADAKITGAFNEDYDDIIRRILTDLRCTYVKYDGDEANPKPQYRIKSLTYIAQQPIEYHFVFLRQISPADGVIPLHDFSLESNGALFAPGNLFGTFRSEFITAEKRVDRYGGSQTEFEAQTDSGGQTGGGSTPEDTGDGAEMGGSTGVKPGGTNLVAGHAVSEVTRTDATSAERVTAIAEASETGALRFVVKAPGLPGIRPLTYCQLTVGPGNAGIAAFSGPCKVKKISHEIAGEGWVTTLYLTKAGGPTVNTSAAKQGSLPQISDGKVSKSATNIA